MDPTTRSTPGLLNKRYECVKYIGGGNFGTCWLAIDTRQPHRPSNSKRAEAPGYTHLGDAGPAVDNTVDVFRVVKQVFMAGLKPDETTAAGKEADLLRKLKHPHILACSDVFLGGGFVNIVTEYCDEGDLWHQIELKQTKQSHFTEVQVVTWLVQLSLALKYLHEKQILHRDLKSQNVFLKRGVIKLGDFGIAKVLQGSIDNANSVAGTPYYMSPETLQGVGYNSKSDIWSLGCVMYETCRLEHLFGGTSLIGLMYQICETEVNIDLTGQYSSELTVLITRMLQKDPNLRPSAADILKTPVVEKKILESQSQAVAAQKASRPLTAKNKRSSKEAIHRGSTKGESALKLLTPPKPALVDEVAMSPRERLKLKKQQEADKRAAELTRLATTTAQENALRYKVDRDRLHTVSHDPMSGTVKSDRPNIKTLPNSHRFSDEGEDASANRSGEPEIDLDSNPDNKSPVHNESLPTKLDSQKEDVWTSPSGRSTRCWHARNNDTLEELGRIKSAGGLSSLSSTDWQAMLVADLGVSQNRLDPLELRDEPNVVLHGLDSVSPGASEDDVDDNIPSCADVQMDQLPSHFKGTVSFSKVLDSVATGSKDYSKKLLSTVDEQISDVDSDAGYSQDSDWENYSSDDLDDVDDSESEESTDLIAAYQSALDTPECGVNAEGPVSPEPPSDPVVFGGGRFESRLRSGAIEVLGIKDFESVYRYIQSSRQQRIDDPTMMSKLRTLYSPEQMQACFLVDQLVYHQMFMT